MASFVFNGPGDEVTLRGVVFPAGVEVEVVDDSLAEKVRAIAQDSNSPIRFDEMGVVQVAVAESLPPRRRGRPRKEVE